MLQFALPNRARNLARGWLSLSLTALLLLGAACAQDDAPRPTAHPFLWKIESDPPSYLYGTIHVPDERVTNLPKSVWDALESCDALLTEIDMGKAGRMLTKMYLPKKETLSAVVPADLHARLVRYLESRRAPPAMLKMIERQKIWAAMMTTLQVEMLELLSSGAKPLDMLLWSEAGILDMERGALEEVEEQIGVFESFSREEQIEMLAGTLDLLEQMQREDRDYLDELIRIYLEGRTQKLQDAMEDFSGIGDNKALERRFEQLLLVDRNVRMVDRLVARMKAEPKKRWFVAVGAAHYAGDKGILKLLADRGYATTRIGAPPPAAAKTPKRQPASVGK